jgi:hypothetical protein
MLHSFVNFYAKVLKILIKTRSISHKNISNSQWVAFFAEISCYRIFNCGVEKCGEIKQKGMCQPAHPLDELKK